MSTQVRRWVAATDDAGHNPRRADAEDTLPQVKKRVEAFISAASVADTPSVVSFSSSPSSYRSHAHASDAASMNTGTGTGTGTFDDDCSQCRLERAEIEARMQALSHAEHFSPADTYASDSVSASPGTSPSSFPSPSLPPETSSVDSGIGDWRAATEGAHAAMRAGIMRTLLDRISLETRRMLRRVSLPSRNTIAATEAAFNERSDTKDEKNHEDEAKDEDDDDASDDADEDTDVESVPWNAFPRFSAALARMERRGELGGTRKDGDTSFEGDDVALAAVIGKLSVVKHIFLLWMTCVTESVGMRRADDTAWSAAKLQTTAVWARRLLVQMSRWRSVAEYSRSFAEKEKARALRDVLLPKARSLAQRVGLVVGTKSRNENKNETGQALELARDTSVDADADADESEFEALFAELVHRNLTARIRVRKSPRSKKGVIRTARAPNGNDDDDDDDDDDDEAEAEDEDDDDEKDKTESKKEDLDFDLDHAVFDDGETGGVGLLVTAADPAKLLAHAHSRTELTALRAAAQLEYARALHRLSQSVSKEPELTGSVDRVRAPVAPTASKDFDFVSAASTAVASTSEQTRDSNSNSNSTSASNLKFGETAEEDARQRLSALQATSERWMELRDRHAKQLMPPQLRVSDQFLFQEHPSNKAGEGAGAAIKGPTAAAVGDLVVRVRMLSPSKGSETNSNSNVDSDPGSSRKSNGKGGNKDDEEGSAAFSLTEALADLSTLRGRMRSLVHDTLEDYLARLQDWMFDELLADGRSLEAQEQAAISTLSTQYAAAIRDLDTRSEDAQVQVMNALQLAPSAQSLQRDVCKASQMFRERVCESSVRAHTTMWKDVESAIEMEQQSFLSLLISPKH